MTVPTGSQNDLYRTHVKDEAVEDECYEMRRTTLYLARGDEVVAVIFDLKHASTRPELVKNMCDVVAKRANVKIASLTLVTELEAVRIAQEMCAEVRAETKRLLSKSSAARERQARAALVAA